MIPSKADDLEKGKQILKSTNSAEKLDAIVDRAGIFGFGFSFNNKLDMLNLLMLCVAGIIISIFFPETITSTGHSGPATTTIWGLSLSIISLFFLIFMSIYFSNYKNNTKNILDVKSKNNNNSDGFFTQVLNIIMNDYTFPIIILIGLLIYIVTLNFIFFKKINSGKVSSDYFTYKNFTMILILIQIGLVCKYMYELYDLNVAKNDINNNKIQKNLAIIKSILYILLSISWIFIFIIHIILSVFSTDG